MTNSSPKYVFGSFLATTWLKDNWHYQSVFFWTLYGLYLCSFLYLFFSVFFLTSYSNFHVYFLIFLRFSFLRYSFNVLRTTIFMCLAILFSTIYFFSLINSVLKRLHPPLKNDQWPGLKELLKAHAQSDILLVCESQFHFDAFCFMLSFIRCSTWPGYVK